MDPKIIRTEDRDGCAIVRVELSNKRGLFVTLDAADYESWIVSGRSRRFILNQNGPLTGTYRVVYSDRTVAGSIAGVARQLLQPGPGRTTHYRDGDRLNLRRSNLEARVGRAKGQTPAPPTDQPA
ncbi:hypothetical protein HNP32_002357 [Brevundimonas bullata]|uniref:Uncharacterized protein n=1 Tax=Brevundimonas bullata TaxID=13160 RepID=A0A7W7IQT7_9CAUL|nr:hypothetical protein [Brevundimonas bullata]MBB4798613.1 hypothetical protein [Brevundimonas bullata]MBB6383072.1 hypothetical protein [Brevundimonas bullata]